MAVTSDPGITLDELRLAARNHAMPLEALRWPITPVGLHYLLVHYDVPLVDPAAWRLEVAGAIERPLTLTLDDIRARPRVELTATMECAGNGRALLEPRPISQPWLMEAVGTARWAGVSLADLLEEAAPSADAVEVVFSALDRGVEGGVEQRYERSLSLEEALEAGAVLAYEMNGAPLPPQHGFPLRLVVPGWYGMTNVKWLSSITVATTPFTGYQVTSGYRFRQTEDEDGRPVTRMRPRSLMAPPGVPDFNTRNADRRGRARDSRGSRLVRARADRARRGERRRRGELVRCGARSRARRGLGVARLVVRVGGERGRACPLLPGNRRDGRHPAARAGVERRRLREQRRPAGRRDRALS